MPFFKKILYFCLSCFEVQSFIYFQMSLDPQHVLAFENIRRSMKTPSRVSTSLVFIVYATLNLRKIFYKKICFLEKLLQMAILTELAKPERSSSHQKPLSIFQKENFSLRLAPPPPMGFSDVI